MGNKVKIHEIAKKLGLSSKEVLEKAKVLGIEASSHLSGLEDNDAKRLEESFTKQGNTKKSEDKPKKSKETKPKKEVKEEPVIKR